ncbi:MAG: S26 family signal peptidase [Planctomycetia bacterium]|nr:S26 family signal peptidase [Planctomycetia bacterium]
MSPALKGNLLSVPCPQCSEQMFFSDLTGVCRNCRWIKFQNPKWLKENNLRFSDTNVIFVDRSRKTPRFGEIILVTPESLHKNTEKLVAKRVWGLPGEKIKIQNGMVYINGFRPVRSLELLEEMRILVHNDTYRPMNDEKKAVSRWKGTGKWYAGTEIGRWICDGSEFFEKNLLAKTSINSVLTYHHAEARVITENSEKTARVKFCPARITNQRAENGTQMRTAWIHPAEEFMLSFRLHTLQNLDFIAVSLPRKKNLFFPDQNLFPFSLMENFSFLNEKNNVEIFYFALNPQAFQGKSKAPHEHFYVLSSIKKTADGFCLAEPSELLISTMDGLPRTWENKKLLQELNIPAFIPFQNLAHFTFKNPFFLKSQKKPKKISVFGFLPASISWGKAKNTSKIAFVGKNKLEISKIILYRNEYFFKNAVQFSSTQKIHDRAPSDGYFLLGDNSYISEDSRAWGRISQDKIYGTLLENKDAQKNICTENSFF